MPTLQEKMFLEYRKITVWKDDCKTVYENDGYDSDGLPKYIQTKQYENNQKFGKK